MNAHPSPEAGAGEPTGNPVALPLTGRLVPIDKVVRDPAQPRRDWRHDDGPQRLDELTASVREFGLLQPLLVHDAGDHYVVIAGGRRLVATQRAGLTEVPVVVRDAEGAQRRILQLLENLQRVDLAHTDEGRAYQELLDLEGLTPPRIALRVQRSEQHVHDRLRLAADQVLADAVERRQLAATVARQIQQLEPLEEAAALRRRVQAGEKLRQEDIDAVKERLTQAGVSPPGMSRRMPIAELLQKHGLAPTPRRAHDAPARSDPAADERSARLEPAVRAASWLERPGPVHSDNEALARLNDDYARYRASLLPQVSAPTPSQPAAQAAARAGAAATPAVATTVRDSPSTTEASLSELLAAGDRAWLIRVVTYRLERGWTCARLLQQVTTAA